MMSDLIMPCQTMSDLVKPSSFALLYPKIIFKNSKLF